MRKQCAALIAISLVLANGPAGAIIIRHDVPDARYLALGQHYRGTFVDIAVPRLDGTLGPGNGGGALIDPSWVITAAHVAAGIKPGHPQSRVSGTHRVIVNGKPYPVADVFLNPDWSGGPGTGDIALIQLAKPVEGGQSACLYSSADEGGQRAILIGSGDSGSGLTGPVPGPNLLRGATATIDREMPEEGVLTWTFAAPGHPGITDLEGISGRGDSGGPALVKHNGKLCVVGVSSAGDGMGRGPGRYGGREFYTRVSFHRPWLEKIMKSNR